MFSAFFPWVVAGRAVSRGVRESRCATPFGGPLSGRAVLPRVPLVPRSTLGYILPPLRGYTAVYRFAFLSGFGPAGFPGLCHRVSFRGSVWVRPAGYPGLCHRVSLRVSVWVAPGGFWATCTHLACLGCLRLGFYNVLCLFSVGCGGAGCFARRAKAESRCATPFGGSLSGRAVLPRVPLVPRSTLGWAPASRFLQCFLPFFRGLWRGGLFRAACTKAVVPPPSGVPCRGGPSYPGFRSFLAPPWATFCRPSGAIQPCIVSRSCLGSGLPVFRGYVIGYRFVVLSFSYPFVFWLFRLCWRRGWPIPSGGCSKLLPGWSAY